MYGGDYQTNFMTQYGLDSTQFSNFFSNTADQFGYYYAQAWSEIATQYGCASTSTCTDIELASLQWGSGGVTQNPADTWGDTYFPKQDTVA